MKNVLMIKNLNNEEQAKMLDEALKETRLSYEIQLSRKCVVVDGNYDMVAIARRTISGLGFMIL